MRSGHEGRPAPHESSVGPAVCRTVAEGPRAAGRTVTLEETNQGVAARVGDFTPPGESLPALCVRPVDAADSSAHPVRARMRMMWSFTRQHRLKRSTCWKRCEQRLEGVPIWRFILRRRRSSTVRIATGRASTSTSSSTSWATPFDLGGPRTDRGKPFVSFLPAVSNKAAKAIRADDPRLAAGRHAEQSIAGRNRSLV